MSATTAPIHYAPSNGANVWKWLCGILSTIILMLAASYFVVVRDMVSQEDLARQLRPIEEQLDHIQRNTDSQADTIGSIKTDIAVIKDKALKK